MDLLGMITGFTLSLLTALLAVRSQHLHGWLTAARCGGIQHLHGDPVPRIGGIALAAGLLAGGTVLPGEAGTIWRAMLWAMAPAFLTGLAEDLTGRVRPRWRLLATLVSGLAFCLLSGFWLAAVRLPGADSLLSCPAFALLFTGFAIGGMAHAFNIIDGVNGLAAGTGMITAAGFATLAALEGDGAMLAICLMTAAVLAGFLPLNFPAGRLFLGDAGAYVIGLLLGAIAVALPMRNPAISPLIGLVGLAYPVIEMAVSVHRRLLRRGAHPGRPDRLHLHSLIHRSRARRAARQLGHPEWRSALAGAMLWPMPLSAAALMVAFRHSSGLLLLALAALLPAYLVAYRRVALLRRSARPDRRRQSLWRLRIAPEGQGNLRG